MVCLNIPAAKKGIQPAGFPSWFSEKHFRYGIYPPQEEEPDNEYQ